MAYGGIMICVIWEQTENKVFWEQMAMTQSHYNYSNKYNKQGINWLFLMDLQSIQREMTDWKKWMNAQLRACVKTWRSTKVTLKMALSFWSYKEYKAET